jgi:secreted Zn-dependent insulinase-like peptidase
LIGHKGDGSLFSYLKNLGLAIELKSIRQNPEPGFSFFTAILELTKEGLSK